MAVELAIERQVAKDPQSRAAALVETREQHLMAKYVRAG